MADLGVGESFGDLLGQLLVEVNVFDFVMAGVPLVEVAVLAVLDLYGDGHGNKIIIRDKNRRVRSCNVQGDICR